MSPDAFRALAGGFPEALLLVRGDGQVLAANPAAVRLLGRSSSEIAGTDLGEIAADPARFRRFLRDCSQTGTMIPGRVVVVRPDGAQTDCRAEGAAVRPASGDAPALLVLRCSERGDQDRFKLLNEKIEELSAEIRTRLRLEAERERLVASEQRAREVAERANRVKDEFLATLSHELRTPLNAIIGWADMLRHGVGEEKAQKGLDTIYRAARSQAQLIDDLLDVSRITTGKLRMEIRPINVAEPVSAAVDSVEPSSSAKGVRLEKLIDPDPGPVSADPERVQQIVWNLLSNAIKFTPRGGRVQVRVERRNSHVEIIVSDTGEGIDPEILPFVFERFRQGEGSLTRPHEGLGLGLSIVRHLVEAHGGHVRADSEGQGAGTTFTVTLPLLVHDKKPTVLASDRTEPAGDMALEEGRADRLAGIRILVIEDDPDSRELLTDLFDSTGASTRAVSTAAEALEEVEESAPDVIVSDIELRGEDGYMFVRKLRKLPDDAGGRIPAVALTAVVRSGDRVAALDAGFQMHLHKPVEPAELIAVVASLADRRR